MVWRNDKNQISCTPSKQSDWLSISSPCYFVSTSKSIYSTSSILLLVEDLLNGVYKAKFIYKKNKKIVIWIWAKFLNPNYFSFGITSTSILPFMFYISPIHFYDVNYVKNQKQYREKIPLKKIKGEKIIQNTYEREREREKYVYLFLGLGLSM